MSDAKKLHYFGSCLPFAPPIECDRALLRAMQRLAICSTLLTPPRSQNQVGDMRMGIDPDTDGIYYYHEDDFARQYVRSQGTLDPAPSSIDGWGTLAKRVDKRVVFPRKPDYATWREFHVARDAIYLECRGVAISKDWAVARRQYNDLTRNQRARTNDHAHRRVGTGEHA